MNKLIIFLIFILLMLCQLSVVSAVTNPSFETGDFTGWTEMGNVYLGEAYANDGVYGCQVRTPGGFYSSVQQQVTLGTTLSYDLKVVDTTTWNTQVWWQGLAPIGNFELASYSSTSGWNRRYIDTTAYNGYHGHLIFRVGGGDAGAEFWLDDLSTTEQETVTLSGWINNTNNDAVSTATILLNNSGGETTTNNTGFYSISGIAPNTYLISVTSASYNDYEEVVVLSTSTTKNITLTYKTPELLSLSILDAGDNSLLLGWKESIGADGVYLYVDDQSTIFTTVLTPYTNVKIYDLTNLEPGTAYNIWAKPFKDSLQGSFYYVSGTTSGGDSGSGGGGGDPYIEPPVEDLPPGIPEYPPTYDMTNIITTGLVSLISQDPSIVSPIISNMELSSPKLDIPKDNAIYMYLLIIGAISAILTSKKEGWELITIISLIAMIISLIKLGWIF